MIQRKYEFKCTFGYKRALNNKKMIQKKKIIEAKNKNHHLYHRV